MVAGTEQGVQKVIDGLTETAKKYDMKINVKKTKVDGCLSGRRKKGKSSHRWTTS
jgi:hypothetical protein